MILSCREKVHDNKEFSRENSKPRRNHELRPLKSNPETPQRSVKIKI